MKKFMCYSNISDRKPSFLVGLHKMSNVTTKLTIGLVKSPFAKGELFKYSNVNVSV